MVPTVMKAIQVQKYNEPYHVSEVAVPKPLPHQVLIRIKAAGFCHTDLMALNGEFGSDLPFIASHEGAGIIEELGADVKGFQKGDRVGCINWDSVCNNCPDCKNNRPIYCEAPKMKGITIDGAWAEYMVADARFMVKLPDDMDFKIAAPLMCAGVTVYGGIVRANLPKGSSIGIIGIGGLGHIGTQVAKCMGYKVAAIDVKQAALDAAASYKHRSDVSIIATDPVEESLKKISAAIPSEWPGLDATVVATDHPSSFKLAAELVKKHGTVVILGQPEKGITLPFQSFVFHDITVVGSLIADIPQVEEFVKLFHENDLHVAVKEWKLDQAEDMRQEYLEGKSIGKNVIVID